ncbi:MAG: hypothetical protein ACK46O_05455 [Flavobacteriia bacterium]
MAGFLRVRVRGIYCALIGNFNKRISVKQKHLKLLLQHTTQSFLFSKSMSAFAIKRALGFMLLTFMALMGSGKVRGQATETLGAFLTNAIVNPSARKGSLSIGSVHSIFFSCLSVSAWSTMVELRKVFDAFFACISRKSEGFNFRAEKKDQFMLLKEYQLSNSKFHQSLVQGDLTLSN